MTNRASRVRLTKTALADVSISRAASSHDRAAEENDTDRLRRSTTVEAMSVELVSAFAGDREMSEAERGRIHLQQAKRGSLFYSDLLYSVSHHYFAPEVAEPLWRAIVLHERAISERLGRSAGMAVAALDYLSNVSGSLGNVTLVSEMDFSELASLALRDGMTGLFNHSACYELLDLELRNLQRRGAGLSVLLLDIDDFKAFNELGGQQAGDRILVELARVLVEEARESDICCRLGGDEFVVVLRQADDPFEAGKLAERIRASAAKIGSHGRRVAVSVGVASCVAERISPHALIDRADRAMRRAKAGGKDRVVLS
jgi:diguanylate cyclase (GGDEF)-like protein